MINTFRMPAIPLSEKQSTDPVIFSAKLEKLCRSRHYRLDGRLKTGDGRYRIYKVTLNPRSRGPTLCISAGIHGNEPSGPWAVLDFLEKYRPAAGDPRIILLPLLNPDGLQRSSRYDYMRINLNRHFFQPLPGSDTRKIKTLFTREKVDFFLSLHEDDEKKGFYLYQYGESPQTFRALLDFLAKRAPICRQKQIYIDRAKDGLIESPKSDGSLEEWLFRRGVPQTGCLEVPDSLPFQRRTRLAAALLQYTVGMFRKQRAGNVPVKPRCHARPSRNHGYRA
jgi:predicted deacylase